MIGSKLQLTRLSDLDGKTIKLDGAKQCGSEYLCIHFTDGSFVVYGTRNDNEAAYLELVDEPIDVWGFYPYQLQSLGLIDEAEYNRLHDEREREEREATERAERETLERLLKKYGKSK